MPAARSTDFLRVARVAPDSKIVGTAQYDAAAGLINLKQWDQAIAVLEAYRAQYPEESRYCRGRDAQTRGRLRGGQPAGRGGG